MVIGFHENAVQHDCDPICFINSGCSLYLAVTVTLPQARLLWVVEPLDPDHHAGTPRLPEALHSAHVGQLWPAGRQEDSAVPDTHCLLAPHNGLIEKLTGFTLQTSSLLGEKKKYSTLGQFMQGGRLVPSGIFSEISIFLGN